MNGYTHRPSYSRKQCCEPTWHAVLNCERGVRLGYFQQQLKCVEPRDEPATRKDPNADSAAV
jgi:hypothetical protein